MRDYWILIGWQKTHEFMKEVYRVSSGFPFHEIYGLANGMVEGFVRASYTDFTHFVQIAHEMGYFTLNEHPQTSTRFEEIKEILKGFHKN